MFQYRRQPTIELCDLEEINKLFKIFHKLTFNTDGEYLFQLEHNFPILGTLVISYYVREGHLSAWRKEEGTPSTSLWSGYIGITNNTTTAQILNMVQFEITNKLNNLMIKG